MILTTRFVSAGFDALTVWPFIFVHPGKETPGLIEHERVHWREQMRWLVLPWWALYLLSKRFRLAAEVRAYRRQIAVGGISIVSAAMQLTKYRTGVTYAQALSLLDERT